MVADPSRVSGFLLEQKMKEETIRFIKSKFINCKNILPSSMESLPCDIINELKEELDVIPEYGSIRNIVYCIARGIELPTCRKCGKRLTYYQFLHGRQYCSNECKNSSDERVAKQRNTVLERYGTDCILRNFPQNKTDEEKKRTKEKRRKINDVKKYGSDSLSSSEKRKMTMLKNHCVASVAELPEVRKKMMSTLKEKYGDNPFCEMKKMAESTNIARYGVSNPLKNSEIREKARRSFVVNSFKRMLDRWKNDVIPMFSVEEYDNMHHVYRWKCVKCGDEFEQEIYTTEFSDIDRYVPRCWKCHPQCSGFSNEEKEVAEYVKSIYDGRVVENDRSVINPFELDIYLPDKRLAIEFDGFYWHSDAKNKDNYYHLNKTELCEKQGIQLIHVFEDEWIEKQEIVKDRIKSILGIYEKRIYARKCIIKEVNSKESNQFLEANHLQGKDGASIRYGLFYQDELVSVMTFGKPRFNKNYEWELIRFASKLGTQIVGGANKLLKFFKKNHDGSIISYADRRYSIGKLYESMGFKLLSVSAPNYWWTKQRQKLSRYQCQKHKLSVILKDSFNPELSETENMMFNGYDKIYDCGNLVYVLTAQ